MQCKRWQSWSVGVDEVRKLAGTLMREGLRGDAGIFVTLSHFTEPAIAEAAKLGIELVDNRELARRIERVRATEPCPICRRRYCLTGLSMAGGCAVHAGLPAALESATSALIRNGHSISSSPTNANPHRHTVAVLGGSDESAALATIVSSPRSGVRSRDLQLQSQRPGGRTNSLRST